MQYPVIWDITKSSSVYSLFVGPCRMCKPFSCIRAGATLGQPYLYIHYLPDQCKLAGMRDICVNRQREKERERDGRWELRANNWDLRAESKELRAKYWKLELKSFKSFNNNCCVWSEYLYINICIFIIIKSNNKTELKSSRSFPLLTFYTNNNIC